MTSDAERLRLIAARLRSGACDALPPAELAFLLELSCAEPPRDERLAERDDAIRAARRFYDGRITPAAAALQGDLERYIARAWPRERDLTAPPATASDKRQALWLIARLNDGHSLSVRQIAHIFENHRGRQK